MVSVEFIMQEDVSSYFLMDSAINRDEAIIAQIENIQKDVSELEVLA